MAKTTQYKNVGGTHTTGTGETVLRDQVFTDPDPDLCTKFPQHFVVVGPGANTTEAEAEEDEDEDAASDVTGDFPAAGENDLTVHRDKRGWHVLDDGEVVSEKALKKKEVDGFIAQYIEA